MLTYLIDFSTSVEMTKVHSRNDKSSVEMTKEYGRNDKGAHFNHSWYYKLIWAKNAEITFQS